MRAIEMGNKRGVVGWGTGTNGHHRSQVSLKTYMKPMFSDV